MKFVFFLVLFTSLSSFATLRGTLGYGYGQGQNNSGNITFYKNLGSFTDNSQLATTITGPQLTIGYEKDYLGVRVGYSSLDTASDSETLLYLGSKVGDVKSTMGVSSINVDIYAQGTSGEWFFRGGVGYAYLSATLKQDFAYLPSPTLRSGAVKGSASASGFRIFGGGGYNFNKWIALSLEGLFQIAKVEEFTCDEDYQFSTGGVENTFRKGQPLKKSDGTGNYFGSEKYSADLTSITVFMNVEFLLDI